MENKTNQWERCFWRSKIKEKCGFYEVKVFTATFNPSRRSAKEKVFCMHPHSLHHVGATQASCEGDKMKCDIPRGKRIV
jgi:hypothetical protein